MFCRGTVLGISHLMYLCAEHKGEYTRLNWSSGELAPPSAMCRPDLLLERFAKLQHWFVSEKVRFRRKRHINLLELGMIRRELVEAASRTAQGLRIVNLCDSRVALGAFAKGRSSSKALNQILRSCLVWSLAGSKLLVNLWIHTGSNPADYPSLT